MLTNIDQLSPNLAAAVDERGGPRFRRYLAGALDAFMAARAKFVETATTDPLYATRWQAEALATAEGVAQGWCEAASLLVGDGDAHQMLAWKIRDAARSGYGARSSDPISQTIDSARWQGRVTAWCSALETLGAQAEANS